MTQQASEPDQDLPIMHGPSGTLAVAALILGLVGMAMALLDLGFSHVGVRTIGVEHPPSLLAVNLSFCSLLMGVAAIYRVRRMPHQTATRLAAIAAVILGLVGPMVFSFQAAHWRKVRAEAEISNVQTIIQACRTWAHHHDGHFPASLGLLAAKGNIDFHILGSPYNPRLEESSCIPFGPSDHLEGAELESLTTAYNNQSDYLYVGSDLTETQAASPDAPSLVVVFAKAPRMKTALTVGFADGHAAMLSSDEIEPIRLACNTARTHLGLKPLAEPTPTTTPPTTK